MGRVEEVVGLARPERRTQVGGVLLAEAHEQRTGAGHPHAIARLAEIVRHRGDEADAAAGLGDRDIPRRAARAQRQVGQRVARGEPGADEIERQIMFGAIGLDLAERHRLDQGQVVAARVAPFQDLRISCSF